MSNLGEKFEGLTIEVVKKFIINVLTVKDLCSLNFGWTNFVS